MITLETIQRRMAEAIKHSGLTQTEIARCLGVSSSAVSHYMRGKKMPALDTFAKLCAILGADANDILCVDEYKTD